MPTKIRTLLLSIDRPAAISIDTLDQLKKPRLGWLPDKLPLSGVPARHCLPHELAPRKFCRAIPAWRPNQFRLATAFCIQSR
jgi:hypothetical protein